MTFVCDCGTSAANASRKTLRRCSLLVVLESLSPAAPAAAGAKPGGPHVRTIVSGAALPGANGIELLGSNRLMGAIYWQAY